MAKVLKKAKADSKKVVNDLPMEIEIPVNDSTKIVARLGELGGKWRIDVRKHITTSKYTGFTKEGVNLPVDYMDALLSAISVLNETVREKGLDKVEE